MVLKENEKVLFEIRRHWYVLAIESSFVILLALIPIMVIASADYFGFSEQTLSLVFFLSVAWILILWSIFFIIWTNYYLDVWVITDQRIIDVEQFSLFSRNVSEFRLDRIQDITVDVKGFLPTMLKFGDIHVQTAGMGNEFHIMQAPEPYKVKDMIVREHDRAVRKAYAQDKAGL